MSNQSSSSPTCNSQESSNKIREILDKILVPNFVGKIFNPEYEGDFQTFLEKIFKEYRKLVDTSANFEKNDKEIILNHCDKLSEGIIKCVSLFLQNKQREALQCFEKLLDNIELIRCVSKIHQGTEHNPYPFFRIRVSEDPFVVKTKKDISHIPFEERHKVKSYRYSLAGFPSLYLSYSLYACWEELNRPDLNVVYFSRFKLKKPLKILFIGDLLPDNICNRYLFKHNFSLKEDVVIQYLKDILATMPLWIACSVPTKHRPDPFNVEYIIPQMLSQWVQQQQGIDGIGYTSTRNHCRPDTYRSWRLFDNYVIFPKSDENKESKTSIEELFEWSDPISFNWLLRCANIKEAPFGYNNLQFQKITENELLGRLQKLTIPPFGFNYAFTDFGKAEMYSPLFLPHSQ